MKKLVQWIQWPLVILLYGVTGAKLWHIFDIQLQGGAGAGDFLPHIEAALDPTEAGYSALNHVYQFLWALTGSYYSMVAFVVLLSLVGIGLSAWFLHHFADCKSVLLCNVLGWFCFCADPIYLPALNPYRTLGVQAFGLWHNPTLLGIKVLGILVVALYAKLIREFDKGIRWSLWFAFAFVLMISTYVKPNLLFCFAPAMAVLMLWDFCRSRFQNFGRYVWLGCGVLPSLGIMLYQYWLLFGKPAESEGNGIAFSFAEILRMRTYHPVISILQSTVFVLLVAVLCNKKLFQNRMLLLCWLMTIFAYFQHICLVETGPRASDGNWTWSTSVSLFLLFLVSASVLFQQTMAWKQQAAWRKGLIVACWFFFAWQGLCGAHYIQLFISNQTFYL